MTMSETKQAEKNKGQSNPIAIVLVFGLVIASTTIVVLAGGSAIQSMQSQLGTASAENSMTQFDSQASLVALGSSGSQRVDLGTNTNGGYQVNETAGKMTIKHEKGGTTDTIFSKDLGKVTREGDDGTTIAYQGGGVWRSTGPGESVMISPPEFHYRDATLTIPLVTINHGEQVTNRAIIRHNNTTQYYPNQSMSNVNPVDSGQLFVTVQSDYYQAWGQYFEARTEGGVTQTGPNEITLELLVPATNPPVQGGLVSGTAGTTLTIKNNAEADSYNSSKNPYGTYPDSSNSKIVSAGDVDIANGAVIEGDVETDGGVSIDKNGEIRGNLSYGETATASGKGYPGGVTGWDESNGSVTSPDSVERLIDTRRSSISSSNDNDDPSVDIDESTKTLENCPSTCELTAGDYYLSEITLSSSDGDNLKIDTNGGDVNIVVDGSVTIQNKQQIEVVGGGRVNVYVEGDYTQRQGSAVIVEDDKAPNFWVYTNPTADVDFDNNAEFTGVLYGPDGADISVDQNAQVYGGLVGDVTFVSNKYGIHYDEALQQTQATTVSKAVPSLTYVHASEHQINVTSG